jgi:hypothetical protein
VSQESAYAAKVAAQGATSLLTQQSVDRYGHCAFTGAEVLQAFGSLTAPATAVRQGD